MMKKYNIIYADCPWSYHDKASAGKRGVEFKYPCMSAEDIKGLPVANISADDCVLFLWCTAPQMPVGIDVIKAWGFEYKTIAFTWVKLNKNPFVLDYVEWDASEDMFKFPDNITREKCRPHGYKDPVTEFSIYSDFMGMGNYTRGNSEFCLLGVKGKPKRIDAGVRQVVMSPREEHSKKPDEVRDRIVKLMGDIPRVELFARQKAEGWDAIGFDIDGKDIRDSIKEGI